MFVAIIRYSPDRLSDAAERWHTLIDTADRWETLRPWQCLNENLSYVIRIYSTSILIMPDLLMVTRKKEHNSFEKSQMLNNNYNNTESFI